jgi:hypothetical protein
MSILKRQNENKYVYEFIHIHGNYKKKEAIEKD